jgi:hypothetical protein
MLRKSHALTVRVTQPPRDLSLRSLGRNERIHDQFRPPPAEGRNPPRRLSYL